MIGNSNVIASIEGSYSIFNEFIGDWRARGDKFVRSWEERFTLDEGYMRIMKAVVSGMMQKYGLTPQDFSKVVLYAPDTRNQLKLVNSLGFNPQTQLQDSLLDSIGNTGTAQVFLTLISALEEAKPGDMILFASYGDGGDGFIFKVTEEINKVKDRQELKKYLQTKMMLNNYMDFLKINNLLTVDKARRPEPIPLSANCLWREQKRNLAMIGGKCRNCGTIQFPPQRVCIKCRTKDNFEDYRFSDKKAEVFTYSIDHLAASPMPPTVFAVINFEGGGRMWCEVTDIDPDTIKIGMPVEMVFRKIVGAIGISNYFWKARNHRI
jgi:uncharacterized OB-fold protein